MTTVVTEHGLRGDQWELRLVANIDGYQVLWLQTGHTRREIYITPKGRVIHVSDPLKPVVFDEGDWSDE